jgi:hypothetical protein
LNYKVWTGFGILEKELVAGPFASSPRRAIAACPGPHARGNAPVAWSPPATSRRRGRPPATPPPRAVHAVTAPGALSRAATVQRRSQFHFLDSSRQRNPLFPLPPTAVLGGDHLLGASPLRSTSGLVFDFPSTTVPWGTSPASSSSPTSTTPTLTGALLPAEFTAAASPPR